MGKFGFRKSERLSREKEIQELFDKGSSFYLFPFKVMIMRQPENIPFNQVLISVSRRNFKNAVDRNTIKRRIREAYRLNKHLLPPGCVNRLGFIYTHKEILPSGEISSKMVHAFRRVSKVSADTGKSS
jgi:ribonuclease P protein component